MKFHVPVLALCLVGLSGCATTGMFSNTGRGLVAMHTEAGEAGSGKVGGKSGEACSTNILGIVSNGDSSVSAAAKAGGIQNVGTVDFKYTNILGLYGQVCTQVTGE
jgi:hypothetical protein